MRPISDPIPNNLNIVWVGHNWEKYFIALFHVSEHVDHFKAKKNSREKTGNSLVFDQRGGTPLY